MNRFPALAAVLLALAACGGPKCPDDFPRVCVKKGCGEKVKSLLAKDPSLLSKHYGKGAWYCLHLAVDAAIVDAALAAGADIEEKSGEGQTPLGSAINDGRGEAVRALLAKGAKLYNAQSHARFAAGRGKVSVLEAMLDNGAVADDALLLHAVINDQAGCVEVLLKRGANASARMGENMQMMTMGNTPEGFRTKTQEVSGKTALQLAKSDAVRDLLKKAGAN